DSLAVGVQPDATGTNVASGAGYADDVYRHYLPYVPGLAMTDLACVSESSASMITGGVCPYSAGSQLGQAVAFLRTHTVAGVTIDIGSNDVAWCISGWTIDQ